MTKHTPGPWHQTKKHPRQLSDRRGYKVAKCMLITKGWQGSNIPKKEAEANARLIAAAPELAEALEDLVTDFSILLRHAKDAARTDTRWDGVYERLLPREQAARAALWKAKGAA